VAVTSPGTVTVGAVVSTTVTVNPPVAVLPDASRAVHVTGVEPSGNVAPDAGVHVTVGFGSLLSTAVAVKFATAPVGPVASTVIAAGTVSTGGTTSRGETTARLCCSPAEIAVTPDNPAGGAALPMEVAAPADDGAVALQRQTVEEAGGDCDHIGQSGRRCRLPGTVVAPADQGAVGLQRQVVPPAGDDRSHSGQPGGTSNCP